MICFPNAKINIGLNIIEKRKDGFHNIQSIFYPIGLCDVLEIVESPESAEQMGIQLTGIPVPGELNTNLCKRAYELVSKDYSVPKIKLHLHKIIPIGAGLGGGSSDAAFFLKLLNDKFELGISWGEQHHYARQLGSDCSFFVTNKPVYAEEKGDVYERVNLDLGGYYLLVVYPNLHVNTTEAYPGVSPQKPASNLEEDILNGQRSHWKDLIKNDFENSVFSKHAALSGIKETLYNLGAVYSSMSGSGSAVYGLFEKDITVPAEFENYFVWKEKLTKL